MSGCFEAIMKLVLKIFMEASWQGLRYIIVSPDLYPYFIKRAMLLSMLIAAFILMLSANGIIFIQNFLGEQAPFDLGVLQFPLLVIHPGWLAALLAGLPLGFVNAYAATNLPLKQATTADQRVRQVMGGCGIATVLMACLLIAVLGGGLIELVVAIIAVMLTACGMMWVGYTYVAHENDRLEQKAIVEEVQ